MLPIKLNGNHYSFPTELSEINLKQFYALRQAKDMIDEICALTGLQRQTIQNFKSRTDLAKCQALLGNIAQKLATGFDDAKLPKQTVMDGKVVKVPRNLKLEPVGAFIAVHNLINEELKQCAEKKVDFDPMPIIPQLLAHYFYLPYMGDGVLYSDEGVEDEGYMEKVHTIPITDAIPIANFFFRRYPNL